MSNYLVVKNDVVISVIVWDGVSPYEPQPDCTLVEQPAGVSIGWRLVNGIWEPPLPPPPKPVTEVSMRQARLALLQNNLLDDVDAAVAASDQATRIDWEYATTVERNNALVASITASLGLTEAQVDDLFLQASKL